MEIKQDIWVDLDAIADAMLNTPPEVVEDTDIEQDKESKEHERKARLHDRCET